MLLSAILASSSAALAAGGEQRIPSTGIVVDGTRLSFEPKTCTTGQTGFAWGLGSVQVKVLGHEDGKCVFDYIWEVEGAGNYRVDRVRVPVNAGPVVIEAGDSKGGPNHWSFVYTSFTKEQATLVRLSNFGWSEVPVGKEFASYQEFREGDDSPPIKRGDQVTFRFIVFLDEKFINRAGAQWRIQRVTMRVGEGVQWLDAVAGEMKPHEIRRIRVPVKIAGPAGKWLPGYETSPTIYAEMQLIGVERK